MKKLLTLLLAVLTAIACAFSISCNKTPLVIKKTDIFYVIKAETEKDISLIEYINTLDEYKDVFVIESGMVTSIGGIKNKADWSYCWMIYTSDEEFASANYGTVEYEGNVYGSATLGAEKLKVKKGCIYIFVYQKM